jgi:hypothetical protein
MARSLQRTSWAIRGDAGRITGTADDWRRTSTDFAARISKTVQPSRIEGGFSYWAHLEIMFDALDASPRVCVASTVMAIGALPVATATHSPIARAT